MSDGYSGMRGLTSLLVVAMVFASVAASTEFCARVSAVSRALLMVVAFAITASLSASIACTWTRLAAAAADTSAKNTASPCLITSKLYPLTGYFLFELLHSFKHIGRHVNGVVGQLGRIVRFGFCRGHPAQKTVSARLSLRDFL
jgi:hypothetical protein